MSDWNKLRKEESLEYYRQHQRDAANSCSHDGCACTSAEVGKCVRGEDHPHVKNAAVGANSCDVADCPCKGGHECTCVGHTYYSNASAGGRNVGGRNDPIPGVVQR